jgi:hypothetical protein
MPRLPSSLTFPAHHQTPRAVLPRMPLDEAHGRYDHLGTPRTLYIVGCQVLDEGKLSKQPTTCQRGREGGSGEC